MASETANLSEFKPYELGELQLVIHQLGVEVYGRYFHDPRNMDEIRAALGLAFSALLAIDTPRECRPPWRHVMCRCVPPYTQGEGQK